LPDYPNRKAIRRDGLSVYEKEEAAPIFIEVLFLIVPEGAPVYLEKKLWTLSI